MDDIPQDVLERLRRLWRIEERLHLIITPRDAWVILGIVQFAVRNPALTARQRQLCEDFGRQLQGALAQIDPELEQYLEMGWHPEYDR